jgi:RHS repeat-associated protein
VAYTDAGSLSAIGTRSYAYDALGRLVSASEQGIVVARYRYDASGRRVRDLDSSAVLARVRHRIRPDFEWDQTRRLSSLHVELDGARVATRVRSWSPAAAASPTLGRPPPARWPLALFVPLVGVVALLSTRRGRHLARPAAAGVVAVALVTTGVPRAVALPDGDLNGDQQLDAVDALLAVQLAQGRLTPTTQDLDRGDVAPLELAPEGPPNIDAADALLILRAAQGEDLDGDGLAAGIELEAGASPFRADSDRDGLLDPEELALGTDPADPDSDGDGLLDAAELGAGSDPLDADTDDDGFEDGDDPEPATGVRYRHVDLLGSTILTTRADGVEIVRVRYRPFGEAVGASPPAIGYTGQDHLAAVALYDYGARVYDPALGRFLQPDRTVPDPLDPQSLNRYAYVRNDPVSRIDPTGGADLVPGLLGAAARTLGGIVSPLLRGAWTAATSGLAFGGAVAFGVPADLLSSLGLVRSDGNRAYQRYEVWATEEGGPAGTPATAGSVGGVGSGRVTRSWGYTADMIEFALIDNVGSNFPAFGRWAARGGYGDAARVTDYLRRRLDDAGDGPLRLGCGSQGCTRTSFALQVLAEERSMEGRLSQVTLDAYGAATRFPERLRDELSIRSYAHPGDVFVSGVFGEYLSGALAPPNPSYLPLPSRSHEFHTYCGAIGTCP